MRTLLTSFLLTAALSQGAVFTYNTLSSWQAGGPQDASVVNFSNVLAGDGQVASPYTTLGFSFSSTNANNMLFYLSAPSHTTLGFGPALTGPASPGGFSIAPPTGAFAIGFLVGLWGSGSNELAVYVNGTQVYLNAQNDAITTGFPGSPTFIGFRSDVAITTLTVAAVGSGNRVNIDNIVWGGQASQPPAETPEAATAILIGSSLLLLPALRRRSHFASPQQPAH